MADDGGLAKFQRRLQAMRLAASGSVAPALLQGANEIAAFQRAAAQSSRKTGALIDNIKVTGPGQATPSHSQPGGQMVVPENMAVVTAGNSGVRYAHLVEYGTCPRMQGQGTQADVHPGTAAQPFFWPGFRLGRSKALKHIKRAIDKGREGGEMNIDLEVQKAIRARLTTWAVGVPAAQILDTSQPPAKLPAIILGDSQAVDEETSLRRAHTRVYHTLHVCVKSHRLKAPRPSRAPSAPQSMPPA